MRPVEWRNHVQDWQRSGLTKRAYAREHNLSYAQLLYWTNKPEFSPANRDMLIPVQVAPDPGVERCLVSVELTNGTQLHIHDATVLTDLIPLLSNR